MKILHYIGDHAEDSLCVRSGCRLTRKVQHGFYAQVTHTEAIHAEHPDGEVTIASSSIRDGGVRDKRVRLNPAHWLVSDVTMWDVQHSIDHLFETEGDPYDLRGAIASVFIGAPEAGKWFCNEHVGYPFIKESATFSPSQFASICFSLGRDVTQEFFKARAA